MQSEEREMLAMVESSYKYVHLGFSLSLNQHSAVVTSQILHVDARDLSASHKYFIYAKLTP